VTFAVRRIPTPMGAVASREPNARNATPNGVAFRSPVLVTGLPNNMWPMVVHRAYFRLSPPVSPF
jgi:hypothetical protein